MRRKSFCYLAFILLLSLPNVYAQGLQWQVFAGPSFSPFRMEQWNSPRSDWTIKAYPGFNLGTEIAYINTAGLGIKTGIQLNSLTLHFDASPFPKNEIVSSSYVEMDVTQYAIPLDVIEEITLKNNRKLRFYAGASFNLSTSSLSGAGVSVGGGNGKDTGHLPVGVQGWGLSDLGNYYSLGVNIGADVAPFKHLDRLSFGFQYNLKFGYSNRAKEIDQYISPYSGITYTKTLDVRARPNFLMLEIKYRIMQGKQVRQL